MIEKKEKKIKGKRKEKGKRGGKIQVKKGKIKKQRNVTRGREKNRFSARYEAIIEIRFDFPAVSPCSPYFLEEDKR